MDSAHAEPRRRGARARPRDAWEARAERYLEAHGLRCVARNHRCRGGEIDLVMLSDETLVFVEVRYRASARHGGAAESVDLRKQGRIVLAAQDFLARHARFADSPCRFDVIAVHGPANMPRCEWIAGAFSA
ncbi:MAG: YraN family protein [Gammaproteobacteria bacterium]